MRGLRWRTENRGIKQQQQQQQRRRRSVWLVVVKHRPNEGLRPEGRRLFLASGHRRNSPLCRVQSAENARGHRAAGCGNDVSAVLYSINYW